jgi:acetolactate synthase-1/3 small subunit
MTHRVISIIVLNEHSVLARISGLFAGRGYNIESLTVSVIPNTDYSRITISTNSSDTVLSQIIKQLDKLIPVKEVIEENLIEKETLLVKFSLNENLSDIEVVCKAYNGHIVNINENEVVAMISDDVDKIDSFIKIIDKYNPLDIVRGGVIAIQR